MPLTDTAMNLVVLSNVSMDDFEIDLSNGKLLNIETNRIFDNKKEIKQKLVMKDITRNNSKQYIFINKINNKNANDLFATLKLGNYVVVNNTLFNKENGDFILVGVIKSISLEESKLIIKLNTEESVEITFKSDNNAIVYKDYKVLFKKYMDVDLKDELYEDFNEKDIKDMYKAVICELYNKVENNV
jgi:hypothetical protein